MNILETMTNYNTQEKCLEHLETIRWGESGVCCPHCGSVKVNRKTEKIRSYRFNCLDCHSSFSVLSGTMFQGTKIPLPKWFLAISMIANAKKSISSCQLARDLDMNQKSAWYMNQRIRKEMDRGDNELLAGVVEADETYVGGKPRKGRDKNSKRGRGTKKAPVVGIAERGGNVVMKHIRKLTGKNLANFILSHIKPKESILMTDEYKGYNALNGKVSKSVVEHKANYVDDDGVTHTNNIESAWAGLKRSYYGTHHWYSKKWIHLYLAEACYKFNERRNPDIFGTFIKGVFEN